MQESKKWPPEAATTDSNISPNSDTLVALKRWLLVEEIPDLDKLAIHRMALWLVHADGYGFAVTHKEAGMLQSDPGNAAIMARRVIGRFAKLMHPPQFEGHLMAISDAGYNVIKEEWL